MASDRAGDEASAAALPVTLICSPGRRGLPAPCALSMILDLDLAATLARGRGFFELLGSVAGEPPDVRMSLKGVGRSLLKP